LTRPATLLELQAHYGARYRWLLLLAVMVGSIAAIMSSTIINVAVPDMSRHFAVGQERAQWVASGFMVAMTVSMLTTPWLLGRYGYRRTYAATMWLLLAGGLVGGFSNDVSLVLAARVAEGLAAGVVQPIPAIVIMRVFAPHEQGRAMGIFGMGSVMAPALGPSLGGWLVDLLGWRSIFFMVVPFCLASLLMSSRFVPVTAPGGVAASADGAGLDWPSLVLASCGTLCFLNGLVQLHGGLGGEAALLLATAEAAGGIAGVLDVVVDYLNLRTAFGRKIGAYQSLKHPAAEILIGLERSRSHLYHAATLLAAGEDAEIALRMAKAESGDAFVFAGDRAVQFHGGFGFTYECDAQLYLRRALWLQFSYGDAAHHRRRLADLLLPVEAT